MEQFASGEIGERIAEARHLANGMTQATLADLIGVSMRSIQDYEAGVTIPWKHLRGIAGATRKEVEWLLYGGAVKEDLRSLVEEMVERVRRIEEILEDRLLVELDRDGRPSAERRPAEPASP